MIKKDRIDLHVLTLNIVQNALRGGKKLQISILVYYNLWNIIR